MKITYSLDEKDYLTFQLFTAFHSPTVKRRRLLSKSIPAVAYLFFAVLFFYRGDLTMLFAFLLLAVVWFFFYPIHDSNLYRRQYQKFIAENMNNKFGRKASLLFEGDLVKTKDEVSESSVKLSEIESITEIPTLFLVKLKTNQSFILPKDKLDVCDKLPAFFQKLEAEKGIPYYVMNNWKWK